MSKAICYDSNGNRLRQFYQWDINQVVTIECDDMADVDIVQVANRICGTAYTARTDADVGHTIISSLTPTSITVKVPNAFLQESGNLIIYLINESGESRRTIHEIRIPIISRAKPHEYDPGEPDIYGSTLAERVEAIENNIPVWDAKYDANNPPPYPVTSVDERLGDVRLNDLYDTGSISLAEIAELFNE